MIGAEVEPAVMEALYGQLLDPRDLAFADYGVPLVIVAANAWFQAAGIRAISDHTTDQECASSSMHRGSS